MSNNKQIKPNYFKPILFISLFLSILFSIVITEEVLSNSLKTTTLPIFKSKIEKINNMFPININFDYECDFNFIAKNHCIAKNIKLTARNVKNLDEYKITINSMIINNIEVYSYLSLNTNENKLDFDFTNITFNNIKLKNNTIDKENNYILEIDNMTNHNYSLSLYNKYNNVFVIDIDTKKGNTSFQFSSKYKKLEDMFLNITK